MNLERIKELADFVEKLPHHQSPDFEFRPLAGRLQGDRHLDPIDRLGFNMGALVGYTKFCETVGCLAASTCACFLSEPVHYEYVRQRASKILEFDNPAEECEVFFPMHICVLARMYRVDAWNRVTPAIAAKFLRAIPEQLTITKAWAWALPFELLREPGT